MNFGALHILLRILNTIGNSAFPLAVSIYEKGNLIKFSLHIGIRFLITRAHSILFE